MKQISFFFLFLTFQTSSLLSQIANTFPTFSDNPKWYLLLEHYSFSSNSFHPSTLKYQADTLLCGQQYAFGTLENKPFFVRTVGDKTYLRNSSICTQPEELIYDFGMKVGDTLDVKDILGWSNVNKFKFKVFSVDTVLSRGKKLKRLKMKYAYFDQNNYKYSMDWVEGVGSNEHPFYPLVPLTSYEVDGAKFYSLCTYHHDSLIYGKNGYSTCSTSLIDTSVFPLYKDAARWNVGLYSSFFPPHDIYETNIVNYQNETTICSKTYSIIKIKGQINQVTAYIRREGRKVYYRLPGTDCSTSDNLLYNFDMKKGDSEYFVYPKDGKKYLYELNSIENINAFGKVRRKYVFQISNSNNQLIGYDTWIEGVGSLVHPFHTFIKLANDGYWFALLCSYSNQEQQYMNSNSKSCYITKVATKDVISSNIEIELSPNPFYNNLTINILEDNNETFKMELYNTIGQKIMQQNIAAQTTLDLAFLPQGTYFIRIQNKDKSSSIIKKIIKI